MITARKTADATIETLNSCPNEECFNLTWKRAKVLSNEIKQSIKGSEFLFKEAKVLQALFGETTCESDSQTSVSSEEHYRMSIFYPSLSGVTAEMKLNLDSTTMIKICYVG